ncbi:PAS domain-containing protein [Cesiribacter sp. SM1]|uniref:PAS domain-containing sensor histidine kinase n=1 Tax=Cesiribacter sp. SM1 TaxID=2861196 RepID=UPI001CD6142E|nr:PAS domain-containing protein [Cesiribacter sp. SM1]
MENHLQQATEANIALAREVNLPLLKVFSHLSDLEFFAFVKDGLENFFAQLKQQTALEYSKESIRKWRTNTLPSVPRGGVATADLVLVYHVRKQMMLDFVGQYTTDLQKGLAIAKELDVFYAQVELFAFNQYVDLKEEEHQAFNHKLQEQQVELEEAFEELLTSREELQQTNEKLKLEAAIRKTAEEVLEKERNFLKAILEHISDGVIACDENGHTSLFNKATREMHGLSERPLPPEQWASYFNLYCGDGETALATAEIPLYRAFRGETFKGAEIVIAPENGKKRLLLADGQPIRSSSGDTLGAVVVMHDVTELRKAQKQQQEAMRELHALNQELATALEELQATEEQLLETNNELEERVAARTKELAASEHQMRLITDAMPVLISYVDADERYRFNNKAYEKWFQQSSSEICGRKIEEVIGNVAYANVKPNINSVLRGDTVNYVTKTYFKEAGLRDISVSYIPHKMEEEVVGFFALISDISEQIKAKEQLEESRDELSFAIEATELGTWDVNPLTNKLKANSRLKEWFGLQPDEEIDLQLALDVIAEKDRGRVTDAIAQAWQYESGGQYDIDYTIVHPHTKQERIVRAKGRAWFNEGKEAYRFNGTLQDQTKEVLAREQQEQSEKAAQKLAEELAAANEELQAANEEIQASNEELHQTNQQLSLINADMDNFIYTASHDLRAPISNIEGLMIALMRNLSADSRQSPTIQKLSGLITQSIERFKRTINDLTQITKIQRECIGEDLSQVDLTEIISEVKLDLAPQIEQTNAAIEINMKDCAPIHFSAKNARSIVYNLLSNAVKYRSPERDLKIRISCYFEQEYQVLSIEDNGLGMDLTEDSKIFAMFKRLHDHVEGSGVGLYIVKKIIENAKGKIEVQSQLNEGSTFRVYFLHQNYSLN